MASELYGFPKTLFNTWVGVAARRFTLGVAIAMLISGSIGCAEDNANRGLPRKVFAETQVGNSRDYGIVKWGDMTDHVATVHGFADDQAACKELADALNANACKHTDGRGCLNPFSCVSLN